MSAVKTFIDWIFFPELCIQQPPLLTRLSPNSDPSQISFAVSRVRQVKQVIENMITQVNFLIFLTARPWAERGSCSTLGLFTFFLTARPWAERGSCSAPGLFFIFFFSFVGDQTQNSTRPNRQRDFKSRN